MNGGRGERGLDGGYCPGIVAVAVDVASVLLQLLFRLELFKSTRSCGCGWVLEEEVVRAARGNSSLRLRLATVEKRWDLLSPCSDFSGFSSLSPFSLMGAGGMGGNGFDATMAMVKSNGSLPPSVECYERRERECVLACKELSKGREGKGKEGSRE